jgi:hypothetical protein
MGSEGMLGTLAGGGWIGFGWLRIWTGGGLLWMRWWTFGFLCNGFSVHLHIQFRGDVLSKYLVHTAKQSFSPGTGVS